MKLLTPAQLTFINSYLSMGSRSKNRIRHAWEVERADELEPEPWTLAMDSYTEAMIALYSTPYPADTSIGKNGYQSLKERGE